MENFIFCTVSVKHHGTKIDQVLPSNYQLRKNPSMYFEEHCARIGDDILLFVESFFFFQTNTVFKIRLVLTK